jgi:predicted RNA binding protein YcfA (HicA-like mRNA interferase family)
MSGRLPVLTGRKVIKALEQADFVVHDTTGSHVVLRHAIDLVRRVTVPTRNRDLRGTVYASLCEKDGAPHSAVPFTLCARNETR